MIKLHTNFGVITVELDAVKAPESARNFLAYAEAGHYDNTVFHRVIPGFMVQGGGFEPGMKQKPVSYTHLDVYKRQRLSRPNSPASARNCPASGADLLRLTSVARSKSAAQASGVLKSSSIA